MTYRYYHLMPDELSTLYIGFARNLFTRPKEREILSIDSDEFQGGCTLFFEDNFLSKLISEYEAAKAAGKFSSSNAASKWLRILSILKSTTPATETQYASAKDYFKSVEYYD